MIAIDEFMLARRIIVRLGYSPDGNEDRITWIAEEIETARTNETVTRAELVAEYRRLIDVCEDLIRNTSDPGTEALAAIYCSKAVLAKVTQ